MPRSSNSTENGRRPLTGGAIGLVAAVALVVATLVLAVPLLRSTPAPPSLVEDGASLMSGPERQRLAEFHEFLLKDFGIDYRVITTSGEDDLNSLAVERFEALNIGGRSRTGRGLLLVIDDAADRVRLEVGYALEGVFTDAFVAYIEHRQMVPFFRGGRVADGILAATELIVGRAQNARDSSGFSGEAWVEGSGGAGATATARLDAGAEAVEWPARRGLDGGERPEITLSRYFAAMAERNGDPNLPIYSTETQAMLRGWTITPAQMDTVARTYRGCKADRAQIEEGTGLAVIRYSPRDRACAPFFFRREAGDWRLDLTMMQRAIRFGRTNAWHFDPAIDHPYRFAFEDWRFDGQGFPLP